MTNIEKNKSFYRVVKIQISMFVFLLSIFLNSTISFADDSNNIQFNYNLTLSTGSVINSGSIKFDKNKGGWTIQPRQSNEIVSIKSNTDNTSILQIINSQPVEETNISKTLVSCYKGEQFTKISDQWYRVQETSPNLENYYRYIHFSNLIQDRQVTQEDIDNLESANAKVYFFDKDSKQGYVGRYKPYVPTVGIIMKSCFVDQSNLVDRESQKIEINYFTTNDKTVEEVDLIIKESLFSQFGQKPTVDNLSNQLDKDINTTPLSQTQIINQTQRENRELVTQRNTLIAILVFIGLFVIAVSVFVIRLGKK